MAELNRYTKQMLSMLPQWMKMRKDPESVGAQFLNVFGLELQDVKDYLDASLENQYIDSIDLSQIDITYKVPIALPSVLDMQGEDIVVGKKDSTGYNIRVVDTLQDFYGSSDEEDVCILDRNEALVYIRPRKTLIDERKMRPYDEVEINGASHYELILHHIWNSVDEFGLLLGLQRLRGERNVDFKKRILDVFVNPGNATTQGLVNALSREFDIKQDHVSIHEFSDPAYKDSMLKEDGTPTQKLISYVERINKVLGFTWDNMAWDEAYWRSVEEANVGFDYLPHIWDATMSVWLSEEFQSGVGDEDDLLVKAPTKQSNVRNFDYLVGVRGVRKEEEYVYPEHSFKYKITAQGTILNQEYKPENYKYTVIASEIVNLHFIVKAYQKYVHEDTINFGTITGHQIDAALEIVDGNQILSSPTNKYLEVEVHMQTEDVTLTPKLESLDIKWNNSSNIEQTFTLTSQADFDRNDAIVSTTKLNSITKANGSVELGYGDFYHVIDTEGDWKKGSMLNATINADGSIQLIRPNI